MKNQILTPFKSRLHKLRVAMYSHDTMGLGHFRRNLLIAKALVNSSLNANVLLINGTNLATSFAMPRGVDCLSLPGLGKGLDGRYKSRSLVLGLREIISIREKIIFSAMDAYEPDVFIIDNVPRGTNRELDMSLEHLKNRGRTKFILGLRDILDEPSVVQREWQRKQNEKIILNYYDAVWIYGDRNLYDPISEYQLSKEVERKIRFTGYLDRCEQTDSDALAEHLGSSEEGWVPPGKYVLCMAGGGQDGSRLLETFSKATLPANMYGVILTGPFIPQKTKQILYTQAGLNPRLKIIEFHPEPTQLLLEAEAVVAMGGYNTVSEILSYEKRALIVPRVTPRQEQLIRAEHMKKHGLLDIYHPDKLTPRSLTQWLGETKTNRVSIRNRIDLKGLDRIPGLLEEVLVA